MRIISPVKLLSQKQTHYSHSPLMNVRNKTIFIHAIVITKGEPENLTTGLKVYFKIRGNVNKQPTTNLKSTKNYIQVPIEEKAKR